MASKTYRLTLNKAPHSFSLGFPTGINTDVPWQLNVMTSTWIATARFEATSTFSYDTISINGITLNSSYQEVYSDKVKNYSYYYYAKYESGTLYLKQFATKTAITEQSGTTTVIGLEYTGTFIGANNRQNIDFTIPDTAGTYNLKLNMQNGSQINAGNIVVGDTAKTYRLTLTKESGATIDCGTFTTPKSVGWHSIKNSASEDWSIEHTYEETGDDDFYVSSLVASRPTRLTGTVTRNNQTTTFTAETIPFTSGVVTFNTPTTNEHLPLTVLEAGIAPRLRTTLKITKIEQYY